MSESVVLGIEGMSCEGCVRRVRKLLENTQTGEVRDVQIGSAVVDVESAASSAPRLVETLTNAGFNASVRS